MKSKRLTFAQLELIVMRARQSIDIVNSVNSGMPSRYAAKEYKISRSTIQRWRKLWQKAGCYKAGDQAIFLMRSGGFKKRFAQLFNSK